MAKNSRALPSRKTYAGLAESVLGLTNICLIHEACWHIAAIWQLPNGKALN